MVPLIAKLTVLIAVAASVVFFPVSVAAGPRLAQPSEIIGKLSGYILPRLDMEDVTRAEALEFIRSRYQHMGHPEERESDFVMEFRLPAQVLVQKVDVAGENLSIAQAIGLATKGVQITLTLEAGKCIVTATP